MDVDLEKIASTIKRVAEEQLSPVVVTEVHLDGDIDHDGDPILRVKIVFESEDDRLDASKIKGMIRHLREPLDNFADVGFPVLRFVTSEENNPAAA